MALASGFCDPESGCSRRQTTPFLASTLLMLQSYDDCKLLVLAWAYGQCPRGKPGLAALGYIRAGRSLPRGRERRERTVKKVLNKTACEKSSSIAFFLAGEAV